MDEKGQETNFQPKLKQFKLCFAPKCAIGRSYVQVNRPQHTVIPVAAKSYDSYEVKPGELKRIVDTLVVKSPKEMYDKPQTENQVYGWYNAEEVRKKHPLLRHGRKLDAMLQENLMNFAQIRITNLK